MTSARRPLSRALTSLGRLQRAHGHLDEALEAYRRALVIQEAVGDRIGVIQSLNAIARCSHGARTARAKQDDGSTERFELAQQTNSPLMIDFAAANLAYNLIQTDDPARGVALLEGLLTRPANRLLCLLWSTGRRLLHAGSVRACRRGRQHGDLAGARGKANSIC